MIYLGVRFGLCLFDVEGFGYWPSVFIRQGPGQRLVMAIADIAYKYNSQKRGLGM